jgi:hypothetical protein
MLDEKSINTVRKIFSKHDYIMTTAELDSYRIYYADIQQLLNEGFIEKIKRGYYHWTEIYGEQEVKIINRLFPDAVLWDVIQDSVSNPFTEPAVYGLPEAITFWKVTPGGTTAGYPDHSVYH